MKDKYRRGSKSFKQQPYRDGWVVWNWESEKWDYFNEEMVSE